MISNHAQFIEALQGKRKVRIQYYSPADSGILDRVCAPMGYSPGDGNTDGLNRYWFWDYAKATESHVVGLLPAQIVKLQLLGEEFAPAELATGVVPEATPAADATNIPQP